MNEDLFKRYKQALEGLTVGGSEYWNEPERCASDIKQKIENQHKQIVRLTKQRNRMQSIPIVGWIIKKLIKQ